MINPLPDSRHRSLHRGAPAKINLGLHVLSKRSDGFHDIETVMVAVEWHDQVSVRSSDNLSFSASDPVLSGNDNLCVRAAEALRNAAGVETGAAIRLDKHLPFGAGLGGGSSDAAATLLLLNELWSLGLSDVRLESIAAELGSDVPFFIRSRATFATGRGEVLVELTEGDDPYAFPFELVIALPNERVSTAEAYSLVTPNRDGRPDIPAVVLSNDLERWKNALINDFEGPIIARHPSIGAVKDSLMAAGAGYAAMSGSGSAVFGVFESSAEALAAAEAMRSQGLTTWHGRAI
jgi:4-diphosphocytidyl-2-C-methyl-D-erythritol kinase